LKITDLGSRPIEQEEKENNNLETSRKRPGLDTDGERSSFIHSMNTLSFFRNFTFDSLFRLSSFPALAKGEENTAEQRTSRKPCSPRSRMKVSFYYFSMFYVNCLPLVFSFSVCFKYLILFLFFTGNGFYPFYFTLHHQPKSVQITGVHLSFPEKKTTTLDFNCTSINIILTAIQLEILLLCANSLCI